MPNLCVENHTKRTTALKAARPLPKRLIPLSTEVLMNLTLLVALNQSHWSHRYDLSKFREQLTCVHINIDINYTFKLRYSFHFIHFFPSLAIQTRRKSNCSYNTSINKKNHLPYIVGYNVLSCLNVSHVNNSGYSVILVIACNLNWQVG